MDSRNVENESGIVCLNVNLHRGLRGGSPRSAEWDDDCIYKTDDEPAREDQR